MQKLLFLLWALLLLVPAAYGEEAAPLFDESITYLPLSWEDTVSPNLPQQDCFLPDQAGYHDNSLDIRIETFRLHDTTVMAAYITLRDVSQFRTGMASYRAPWTNTTTVANMCKRFHAVMAINGDYFGYHEEGIVCRNGKVLRCRPVKRRDQLLVDVNGDLHVLLSPTLEDWNAVKDTTLHAFCFGPALVIDGQVNPKANDTKMDIGKNKSTQRIAIGQLGPLQYLVVATEGPENKDSVGFTISEIAQLMADMGCSVAYNLDGGSSSTIALNDEKINALSTGKKRTVSDCIWFATLVPNEQ